MLDKFRLRLLFMVFGFCFQGLFAQTQGEWKPIKGLISGNFRGRWALVQNEGKKGLINKNGDLVLACQYEDLHWDPKLSPGTVLAKKSGKWGLS